jgi:predicted nucleotidyltransferase
VDFSTPISTVIPSLDGPVLQVLARSDRMLSGRQVHAEAGTGSVAGVRLVLQRLASTGLVHVDEAGSSLLYRLNRSHLAAQAVELLANLRATFADTLAANIAAWRIPPLHASLYGAAARGEGDLTSDVALLLIRSDEVATDNLLWEEQVGGLMSDIVELTGNPVDVDELSLRDLANHHHAAVPVIEDWLRDPAVLHGPPLAVLLTARASVNRPILADLPSLPDLANFPALPALTTSATTQTPTSRTG